MRKKIATLWWIKFLLMLLFSQCLLMENKIQQSKKVIFCLFIQFDSDVWTWVCLNMNMSFDLLKYTLFHIRRRTIRHLQSWEKICIVKRWAKQKLYLDKILLCDKKQTNKKVKKNKTKSFFSSITILVFYKLANWAVIR